MTQRSTLGLLALLSLAGGLVVTQPACTGAPPERVGVSDDEAVAIALQERTPSRLEIAPQTRPDKPSLILPLDDGWSSDGRSRQGASTYRHALPVRPRSLFFFRAKPGMEVRVDGEPIPYGRNGAPNTWSNDADTLTLHLPEGEEPSAGRVTFRYDKALLREANLHRAFVDASMSDAEFVRKQIQEGWDSRSGLLLPAPGLIEWELTLPPMAEWHFSAGIARPELLDQPPSDGARLIAEVEVDGKTTQLLDLSLSVGEFPFHTVDLSAHSGKTAKIRLRSDPGASNAADLVFVGEPAVASRKADPRTVLMVFIDTLRPDHLGLYGYERDTTAAIDHLAESAAIFTNARSIAPWTLPSARTIVTGQQPEAYDDAITLQETLRAEGYATAFIAGNVYLSANFDMHRGWDLHRVGLWPPAEEVTDDAIAWLDERRGRDALLMVHYMDAHLPYIEPRAYRHLYAGDGPKGLEGEFHLPDIRKANLKDEADRQYVRDRYDNNIRYTTDQVQRLVSRLDDNDVLLIFADHGEEFWDHGGFEHGHTTFDELLRVPLVVRAPGVPAGRIDAPVSLLDLTPTVLDLVGVDPAEALDGSSLLPLAQGAPEAVAAFAERDHAFGRPLYGRERWGVIVDDKKWASHNGRETLHDLAADPGETKNLFRLNHKDRGKPYREALSTALDMPVDVSWRLLPSQHRGGPLPSEPMEILCSVPGGVRYAWVGDDPLDNADATTEILEAQQGWDTLSAWGAAHAPRDGEDDVAFVRATFARWGPREAYITPEAGIATPARCSARYCPDGQCEVHTMEVPEPRRRLTNDRSPLARANWGQHRSLEWGYAIAPMDPRNISGRDEELNAGLEAMGYVSDEGENASDDDASPDEP
jgi:arylsulfatase A-like enzyme